MSGKLFKLKSAKVLFVSGAGVSILVAGFASFRDREEIRSKYSLDAESFWEQLLQFTAISFVLLVNLFYCSKLIEGIAFHMPYKILPWICINAVNLVQLAIYFFSVDSTIGYLTLLSFCYIWLTVLLLFFETKKNPNDESVEFTQRNTAPIHAFEVPYGNMNNDR